MTFKYPGYEAICEHCGSSVPVANVCPKCGRDHTADWHLQQEKDMCRSSIGILTVFSMILIGFIWGFFG